MIHLRKIFQSALPMFFSLIFMLPVFAPIQFFPPPVEQVSAAELAQAQSPATDRGEPARDKVGIPNPLKAKSIYDFIVQALEVVLRFGSMLGALAIVYSGFKLVFAQGNEEKIGDAKKALWASVIGTGVLLASWTIAKIIENTINQITS
jgi:hypothetical protein